MNKKFKANPNKIAGKICGLISFLSFLVSLWWPFLLPRVDNPSSTDSIAYFITIILSLLAGAIGFFFGYLIFGLINSFVEKIVKTDKKYIISLFILILPFTYFAFSKSFEYISKSIIKNNNRNEINRLGEKFNSGLVTRVFNENQFTKKDDPKIIYTGVADAQPAKNNDKKDLSWNGKLYKIFFNSSIIVEDNQQSIINENLSEYNNIIGINYSEVGKNSNLLIIARLRTTSFQSMILIYSKEGQLIYKELIVAGSYFTIKEDDAGRLSISSD